MSTALVRRHAAAAAILISVLGILAQSAHGQSPVELRGHVVLGAFGPRGDLPFTPILASPTTAVSYDGLPELPALGLGLELDLPALPIDLRLEVLRSIGRTEVGVWGCADEKGAPLPCPAVLIEVPTEVTASSVTVDAVRRMALPGMEIQALLGLGWMRYDYDWDPDPTSSFALGPGDHAHGAAAFHYGIGVGAPVGTMRLNVEYGGMLTRSSRRSPTDTRSLTARVTFPLG